ncbi:PfkB family carbohydrate kinase [Streptomyces sp. NPDC093111]|uniref:PfkB family carbohydrate kinase n=1 Tax=Streptomyces sp. NPDC093111 TaxID=3154978 RepID=UPI0034249E95
MMTFLGADRRAAIASVAADVIREVDHVHLVGEPRPGHGGVPRAGALNLMNADEAARLPDAVPGALEGTALRYTASLSGHVILTLGPSGTLGASPDGRVVTGPTMAVRPVDRTRGGDAFDADFLAGWSNGETPASCLRRGLDAALHVITKIGAQP